MRVLLAANAAYAPPRGGSTRSNLVWLRALAARGHECRVMCPEAEEGAAPDPSAAIAIAAVKDLARHPEALAAEIRAFAPDWVLISSEDLSHTLLREAHRCAAERLIYLAHTPQFFPFGRESWNPEPGAAGMVKEARAIVAIGEHMAGYIESSLCVRPRVIHPPIYGRGPWPDLARFEGGFALMINPCEVKGIRIFAELARRLPRRPFAALAGWGTTRRDRAALAGLPNVTLLETVANIDEALRRASVLLMPSVWYEGFGLIAMEAMLRGIPAITSDSGGLLEAKRGTGYVVPVRPVERYLPQFDENHMPEPVLPDQNIDPWEAALEELLTSRDAYEAESRRSRDAALRFVAGLRAEAFEEMLSSLAPGAARPDAATPAGRLSAAQRALLLQRLRQKTRQ